jgi:KaiC/GvpD/RAD55 family RecA-like ATPase
VTAFTVENFRSQAAADYAARGWRVIPLHNPRQSVKGVTCSCGDPACKSVGKHPRTANGLKDASTEAAALAEWWGRWPAANVGVVTGAESGLVVLDVDPRHGGAETLAALEAEFGLLPPTVRAVTGGGGTHVYFSHPGRPVRNSSNRVGPGLDVRGDGGYVAAAPSLHASGNRYGWETLCGPEDLTPALPPGWLLARMTEPVPQASTPPRPERYRDADTAGHWIGRALMRAAEGNRNETGLWLAAQLRDAGVSQADAESSLCEYARRCPSGGERYTEREAVATARSAYARPPREPAKAISYAGKVIRAAAETRPKPVPAGAADELAGHLERIIAREVYNVPWPWPETTRLTQALLPGSIVTVCGDPGVGKTFFVLDCLQFWDGNDFPAAAFFIEKDRKFHTLRLLAQLEGDGRFVDWDWLPGNAETVRAAAKRNADTVNRIGRLIYSAPAERVTLDSLLAWTRQQASAGRRVLVVDPITAAFAGVERWTKDDDFVLAAQAVLNAHEASLVLVTHPAKGAGRFQSTSGHAMGGGAAYFRFSDTTIWLHKPKKPRRVQYRSPLGPTDGRFGLFFQFHKTRDGRGANAEVAFRFGEGLRFAEQGIVMQELPDEQEVGAA